MKSIIRKLSQRQELSPEEVYEVVHGLTEDRFAPTQVAGFLMGLVMKGPTTGEIAAIARAMRQAGVGIRPRVEGELTDTCGTGGGLTTFNVSTANALLSAAAGVRIAKHGSRSISASSGSADVLEALGIPVELLPHQAERLIEEVGFSFLYAPYFHPVMMKVFGPENDLGIKTIFFTVIGPLINPAGARCHVLGVYRPELVEQVAEVALELGLRHVLVVHGVDGVDEISLLGETRVAEVKNGRIEYYTLCPEDFGFARCQLERVRGGSPEYNARVITDIFSGRDTGPRRDMLLLNAAATLYVSGKVDSLEKGVDLVRETLESGRALVKLEEIRTRTQAIRRDAA
ncbi:MAG: anthranilate phosphoribosyltransferase [Moorellales bacterium]